MVSARSVAERELGRGRRVAVFGATGHTGRFVISELVRRGIEPVAVARSGAKLAELGFVDRGIETHEASVDEAGSLDRAFAGVGAVVNCAGPFLDTADAVATAALRAHAHYLDVTAEQPSARATFEKFDKPARDAGVVVIPAMGFYGGFADLLVTAAISDWEAADEIRIGIALDSWNPTQGTRITGERNTARRMVVADGQLAPLQQPAAEMTWEFPQPFARQTVIELPFSEIIVIGRHLRAVELHTYLNQTALRDVRNATTPPPVPADETGRSAQRFAIEAIVRKDGETRRITAQGRDIYAFSAPLVGEAVERLLRGGFQDTGAQAPGAIFDARDFLQTLAPDNLTFQITDGEPRNCVLVIGVPARGGVAMNQIEKAQRFATLHVKGSPLMLYNVWDAGSAKAVSDVGAAAIATSSWAVAAAHGYEDGEAIPVHMVEQIVARVTATIDLPVTVDFEGGYTEDDAILSANVSRLVDLGIVGINFEDRVVTGTGLYGLDRQAQRIAAIRRMANERGIPLFINARTDLFLGHGDNHATQLGAAQERAAAYAEAGASGFFIPGLVDDDLIRKICDACILPVNVMFMAGMSPLHTLGKLGVARISFGPSPYIDTMKSLGSMAQDAHGWRS